MATVLCILCNTQLIQAQEESTEYNNEIRFGMFQLLGNTFYTSYERLYSNYGTSFSLAFTNKDIDNESVNGYFIEIDQKFYLKNVSTDIGCFYFSPGIKYRYREYKGLSYTDRLTTYGAQVAFGVKYILFDQLVLDIYFGGNIRETLISKTGNSDTSYDNNMFSPGYSGISPVLNCTFGFQF